MTRHKNLFSSGRFDRDPIPEKSGFDTHAVAAVHHCRYHPIGLLCRQISITPWSCFSIDSIASSAGSSPQDSSHWFGISNWFDKTGGLTIDSTGTVISIEIRRNVTRKRKRGGLSTQCANCFRWITVAMLAENAQLLAAPVVPVSSQPVGRRSWARVQATPLSSSETLEYRDRPHKTSFCRNRRSQTHDNPSTFKSSTPSVPSHR